MNAKVNSPDYLFEVSWEVCNKTGIVHEVISGKATEYVDSLNDNYILVGPDVWRSSGEHPEFIEDSDVYSDWKTEAQANGLMIRTG
jgi:phosphorylase/glycogen(starch) synthase